MRKKQNGITILSAFILMLLLIIYSKQAAEGAFAGIELCLRTVIPSLFPFFVVSAWINPILLSIRIPLLQGISHILGIPQGCEGLLLMGLIGGYPVGAQAIAEYYQRGCLSKEHALRLLGFCNNAGPAFIFGIGGNLFPNLWIVWIVWAIHVLSAIITGFLLPYSITTQLRMQSSNASKTFTQALKQGINATVTVCAWIILFRALGNIFKPLAAQFPVLEILSGFLELSGGCCNLIQVNELFARYILYCVYLGFGGMCVLMQTVSVTQSMGVGLYPIGKIMQTAISFIMAWITAQLIFTRQQAVTPFIVIMLILSVLILFVCRKYSKIKYGNFLVNSV